MKKVWSKTKGVRKERVGIWTYYLLLRVSLLVYIFALAIPGSVDAKVINVPNIIGNPDLGDVYGPNGLIAAITAANDTEESDDIVLSPGTYFLTRPAADTHDGLNGLPSIIHETSISCPGGIAIIQRGVNADEYRIFHNNARTGEGLTLSNIHIRGGRARTYMDALSTISGGGLFNNYGKLTLINCTVSDNKAGDQGGGIYNNTGQLILDRSTISSNRAETGGGGFYTTEGLLIILNSTISGNSNGFSGGGGFFCHSAVVTLENSTVSTNSSGAGSFGRSTGGGGIVNVASKLTVTNSTISGNKALSGQGRGGGIFNDSNATLDLDYVTITNNTAQIEGGGIYNSGPRNVTVRSTIIAGNFDARQEVLDIPNNHSPDCDGTLISLGFNLIGNTGILSGTFDSPACTLIGSTIGNIVGG